MPVKVHNTQALDSRMSLENLERYDGWVLHVVAGLSVEYLKRSVVGRVGEKRESAGVEAYGAHGA